VFLEYLRQSDRFREAAPKLRRGAAVYAPSFYAPYVLAGIVAESGGGGGKDAARESAAAGWLVAAPEAERAMIARATVVFIFVCGLGFCSLVEGVEQPLVCIALALQLAEVSRVSSA